MVQFFGLPNSCPTVSASDVDSYGGVDPLGVFPLFLNMVADTVAPKLRINFCRLIRLGSFPECWQSTNITAIPKGASSSDRETTVPYQ